MSNIPNNLKIFTPKGTEPDAGAIQQITTCMTKGDAAAGSLSADHHLGYSAPIGGSIGYADFVSPSSVGYDIGCGNKAVATTLRYSDIKHDMDRIMDAVTARISFGMGQPAVELTEHPVLDKIKDSDDSNIRNMYDLAAKQLGTVGSGNHYVDIFCEDETDRVWIGVHFGSRGFGHKTASGFLSLAQGKSFTEHPNGESMMAEPTLLDVLSDLGCFYIEAMELAGEYAYAGRDIVVDKVLSILGNPSVVHEVHNHHNFSWLEEHGGEKLWVVRKGATPLFPGQQGFVGGSMGENAAIIEGSIDFYPDAYEDGEASLWSAPHGAGRAMSRTEAKGKQRKRQQCVDCGWTQQPGQPQQEICPQCGHMGALPEGAKRQGTTFRKVWVQETPGKIDWQETLGSLARKGIVLRGGDADEAPGAYKRLPAVLDAHSSYVKVVHQLRPVGVAMAGRGVEDPYKD